jgi:16S rRNA (guanine527-N7)-methyltransferase
VEDHVRHAAAFVVAVGAPPDRGVDLGSGGGVPGLVLALEWSTTTWVLLDASERRTEFLTDAVDELGLTGRVEVRRARAESAGRDPACRGHFDLVVARAFGSPAVTAECAAPLLRTDGVLVVSEPPAPSDRWPAEDLALLGLEALGRSGLPDAGVQVLQQVRPCPERYPRRVGIPSKRPLW